MSKYPVTLAEGTRLSGQNDECSTSSSILYGNRSRDPSISFSNGDRMVLSTINQRSIVPSIIWNCGHLYSFEVLHWYSVRTHWASRIYAQLSTSRLFGYSRCVVAPRSPDNCEPPDDYIVHRFHGRWWFCNAPVSSTCEFSDWSPEWIVWSMLGTITDITTFVLVCVIVSQTHFTLSPSLLYATECWIGCVSVGTNLAGSICCPLQYTGDTEVPQSCWLSIE